MRRMLFLLYLFLCLIPVNIFAGVGGIDNRYYVTDEMRATHPYNKFVYLEISYNNALFGCSAQYVSSNLVLSAAHCVKPNGIYKIKNYKGEIIPVSLLAKGNYQNMFNDWAVWKINDSQFYSDVFFDVTVPTRTTPVINAGYGWMRILTKDEIYKLRTILAEIRKEKKKTVAISDVSIELDKRAQSQGLQPLHEKSPMLKASNCYVVFEDCSVNKVAACQNKTPQRDEYYPLVLASSCDSWSGNSGGGYISRTQNSLYGICSFGSDSFYDKNDNDYLTSAKQFKTVLNKLIQENRPQTSANVSQQGNTNASTGATNTATNTGNKKPTPTVETTQNNTKPTTTDKPVQTASTGATNTATNTGNEKPTPTVETTQNDTNPTTTDNPVQTASTETSPDDNTYVEMPEINDENLTENTLEEEIQNQQNIVDNLESSLNADLENTESMNDSLFLNFLDKMVEYQVEKERLEKLKEAYDEAKKKEQSFENRMLTAATVAATGIGGMQLMQGLAEQSADKDATADMTAYIETMRCTYGEGKQVKAGTEEIELPGANDETLMKLRAEYLALATDLKERKEALGMKAGIESEEILDRASSGLYDDESIGINNGAYASLYRAQMLQSEADKKKIDDAASTSKNRVTGGAIAAGAGIVVGIAGNSLLNGKLGEAIKNKNGNKVSDKTNDSAINKLKKGLETTGLKNVDKLDFTNLDLSGMASVIDKIDFSSMKNLSDKDATEVLDTEDNTGFVSSLSKILGDKNATLFQ